MAPVRRPEGTPPPAYGNRSTWFSVEINHGGHFVGHGRNRSYVDGRAVWFDQLDKVTWSTIMLENIVEDIGWEMAGRVKAYYCVPMLSLERNGLRALQCDDDVDRMMNLLAIGYHFFSIFLDHDGSFPENSSDEDDVVRHPISKLPPNVSPCKNVHNRVDDEEPHRAGVGDVEAHVRMKAEQFEKRKQAAAERSAKKKEEARVNKLARERTKQIIAEVKKDCARKQEAERKAIRELQKQQAAAGKEEQKKRAAAAKEEEKKRAAAAKEDERKRVNATRAEEQRIAGLEIAYKRRLEAEARKEKEQEAALGSKRHATNGSSVPTHPPTNKTSMFDVFR